MLTFIIVLPLIILTIVFFIFLSGQEKEKNEFFHVMAHRFRSPISIIRWYVELLSAEAAGNLNDKQRKYFTEIYNASEKLNETIDSLVILLQLQSHNLPIKSEKINIKDLITQIIQKIQFKIERHKLHLQEIYPKEQDTVVQTDSKLLNIVLQNLLENAIIYSPENGNIDIKVDLSNKKLFIEIKDEGLGIPKEGMSRLLANSIYSKDMRFSLYLTRLILRKIRAHINFKSEENKGTTFSISLPV